MVSGWQIEGEMGFRVHGKLEGRDLRMWRIVHPPFRTNAEHIPSKQNDRQQIPSTLTPHCMY